jgi:hypothetical protein
MGILINAAEITKDGSKQYVWSDFLLIVLLLF